MWLSASCYFYRYTHVYSPVAFPKRFDPKGDYVRKWLPQFAAFPAEFIYEPWKAPLAVQKRHGIVVGESYPARIVIHEDVVKTNVGRIAEAYRSAGNRGPAGDTSTEVEEAGASGTGARDASRPRQSGTKASRVAGVKRSR